MWRHYLTIGVRALAKNRTYAAINIAGLATGLAACLLIGLFVREHLSFDRFIPGADQVYQLQAINTDAQTGAVDQMQMTPYALGPAFVRDFPQVEAATYLSNAQPVIMDKGEPRQLTITQVGPGFLKVFPIRFVRGSAATALPSPDAVAVSQKTAKLLFGTEDVVGRTISVQERGGLFDRRISAVFADLPRTSHNRMGMMQLLDPAKLPAGQEKEWGWFSGYNYFRLKPGTDVAAINAQLDAWKERNAPKDVVGGKLVSQAAPSRFHLVALPDVHLGEARGGPAASELARSTVVTFAVLALLILVMACVNFTNLSTARASQRAREVALRKVLGARRGQLIVQFLAESVIVAGVAMLLAMAAVELALPWLRRTLGADLALSYFGAGGVLLPVLALTLLVGVAGGLYPAFYLTRFQPAQVLKANKSAAEAEGSGRLRNALVVAQFAITIGLIVCTAVVHAQTVFARAADPGFRRGGLVQVANAGRGSVVPSRRALEGEFARVPGVQAVSTTGIAMATSNMSNNAVLLPGRPEPLILGAYPVGARFFETMGMTLLAGRFLSEAQAKDDASYDTDAQAAALTARGINVVVNESSARQMGFRSPAAAIGGQFRFGLLSTGAETLPATIVGVVADSRFRSARTEVEDIIFYRNDQNVEWFVIRTDGRDPAAVMAALGAAWKRVVPTVPFQAQWSDDAAGNLYRDDEAQARVFAGFALLSVLIGCLGLFGLAIFTAERRTREIGVRKVLGARTRDIVGLLVWQFARPVVVANLIAWPLAWWAMRRWLNGFDARIALTPVPFLVAGGLALLIAVATIAGHAWRVARETPIRALRYE